MSTESEVPVRDGYLKEGGSFWCLRVGELVAKTADRIVTDPHPMSGMTWIVSGSELVTLDEAWLDRDKAIAQYRAQLEHALRLNQHQVTLSEIRLAKLAKFAEEGKQKDLAGLTDRT
jgi:hypothetical protein